MKFEGIYEDLAADVEIRFDTSNYEVKRPLPIGKNKNVTRLMRDELGGKIMEEIVALIPKMYIYFTDERIVDKKTKTQRSA